MSGLHSASAIDEPLLCFAGVACRRGGRRLFGDLHLALCAGEGLRLTGPNGVGKSSLLRLAAGLLDPAEGTISRTTERTLANDDVALDREQRLAPALGFWCAPEKLDPALAAFGLADLGSVPVRLLSTGELRRARLARVVARGAPLWLLDEPLNGLDDDGVERLERAIAQHRAGGGAVLAASHTALRGEWRTLELVP